MDGNLQPEINMFCYKLLWGSVCLFVLITQLANYFDWLAVGNAQEVNRHLTMKGLMHSSVAGRMNHRLGSYLGRGDLLPLSHPGDE